MQRIHANKRRLINHTVIRFLARSFLFALIYASLLYAFVRMFFFDFPFTIAEGFELHGKMLLVSWLFIIACKMALSGINILENSINRMRYSRAGYITLLKRTMLVLVAATLAFVGKSAAATKGNMANHDNNSKQAASH